MIVRVNVALNRTVAVERLLLLTVTFEILFGSHLQSQR